MPKARYRQSVPLFIPLVALIAGIVAGSFAASFWVIVPSAVAVIVSAVIRQYYPALLFIIFAAGSTLAIAGNRPPLHDSLADCNATYSGIILERTDKDRTVAAIIAVDSIADISGTFHRIEGFRANVYFFDSYMWLSTGRRVRFTSQLSHPVYNPDLPDDTDLSNYWRYKEISATGVVFSNQVHKSDGDSQWRVVLHELRQSISDKLHHGGISDECAAFLDAILLGDDSRLDRQLREDFTLSGLSHIVALSGTHVAIIALLVTGLLFPLHLLGQRKAALILSVLILFLYAFVTGLSASVLRSVIMASVVILAYLSDRAKNSLNALCLAAILIHRVKPSEIFSPGMQMSFMAVASILLLANAINPVSQRHRIIYRFVGAVTTILAAVAGTWIISCHYFHYTALWFLPVNLPMVLLVPVEIIGGAFLIFSEAIGLHIPFLAILIDEGYSAISCIASTAASIPSSGIRNIFIKPWCIPVYFIGIGVLSEALRSRRAPFFALAASLFIATWGIAIIPCGQNITHDSWYITHDNSWTDIVAYTDDNAYIATTAWRETPEETVSRFTSAHSGFLSRRGIDLLHLIAADRAKTRQRKIISLGKTTFAIAGEPADTLDFCPQPHSHYTIVTRNSQNMSVREIQRHYHPDTVLLANEIYPSVHDRLVDELQSAGQPFISLRTTTGTFSRSLYRVESKN